MIWQSSTGDVATGRDQPPNVAAVEDVECRQGLVALLSAIVLWAVALDWAVALLTICVRTHCICRSTGRGPFLVSHCQGRSAHSNKHTRSSSNAHASVNSCGGLDPKVWRRPCAIAAAGLLHCKPSSSCFWLLLWTLLVKRCSCCCCRRRRLLLLLALPPAHLADQVQKVNQLGPVMPQREAHVCRSIHQHAGMVVAVPSLVL